MPPKNSEFGDLSSNIALIIAKDLKQSPMDVGRELLDAFNLNLPDYILNVTVTKPGFLNFEIKNR